MKALYLTTCILLIGNFYAQIEYKILDQNNVAARVTNMGILFHDYYGSGPAYEVPKGSGNHLIQYANFWFAGTDLNDAIHMSQGWVEPIYSDVFPGPYSTEGDYSSNENWKVWTICQSEIDIFNTWWESTLPGADPVEDIQASGTELLNRLWNWPAHGDISLGQAFNIAPFYDRNQDGVYDPLVGDYPVIKGCCATYMVQNDADGLHTNTGTAPIGLEMHYMIYQYESDDYINDATFIDVMAINRGIVTYPQFAHGLVIDSDLGFAGDDFMGSDSINNMLYFYNGDNDDEMHYGVNPPAFGIVSLNRDAASCAPYSHSTSNQAAWNMLQGKKQDGGSWTNPGNTPTNFVFSGDPGNITEWSEMSTSGIPGDRSGIMTHNDGSFVPGDTIFQSYAILYARAGDHIHNVQILKQQAASVKLFYADDTLMCSSYVAGIEGRQKIDFAVHPNPSEGFITLDLDSYDKIEVGVLQPDGKTVFTQQLKTGKKTLDLSSLPRGIYFLKIDSEKGSNIQKIILR